MIIYPGKFEAQPGVDYGPSTLRDEIAAAITHLPDTIHDQADVACQLQGLGDALGKTRIPPWLADELAAARDSSHVAPGEATERATARFHQQVFAAIHEAGLAQYAIGMRSRTKPTGSLVAKVLRQVSQGKRTPVFDIHATRVITTPGTDPGVFLNALQQSLGIPHVLPNGLETRQTTGSSHSVMAVAVQKLIVPFRDEEGTIRYGEVMAMDGDALAHHDGTREEYIRVRDMALELWLGTQAARVIRGLYDPNQR